MIIRSIRRCRRSRHGAAGIGVSRRLAATSTLAAALIGLAGCGGQSPLPQYTGDLAAPVAPVIAAETAGPPGSPATPATTQYVPVGTRGEAFLPSRLLLDTIGVDAPVIEVGVADRVLGVPEDPRELGRWSDGARPNDGLGSIVLTGHVDYQGLPGALRPLVDLQPGDEAVLTGDAGEQTRYVTDRVDVFSKTALPYEEIFQYDVAERLVLITCGGSFDSATGHYDSNVVAYLRRV